MQSAKMSLIRKEEVTVLDWEGAESGPACRGDSSPAATPCLCATAASKQSLPGERGDGQPLLISERGLSSSGERHSPIRGSPLGTEGLPGRCERMESIPKPLAPSMTLRVTLAGRPGRGGAWAGWRGRGLVPRAAVGAEIRPGVLLGARRPGQLQAERKQEGRRDPAGKEVRLRWGGLSANFSLSHDWGGATPPPRLPPANTGARKGGGRGGTTFLGGERKRGFRTLDRARATRCLGEVGRGRGGGAGKRPGSEPGRAKGPPATGERGAPAGPFQSAGGERGRITMAVSSRPAGAWRGKSAQHHGQRRTPVAPAGAPLLAQGPQRRRARRRPSTRAALLGLLFLFLLPLSAALSLSLFFLLFPSSPVHVPPSLPPDWPAGF